MPLVFDYLVYALEKVYHICRGVLPAKWHSLKLFL